MAGNVAYQVGPPATQMEAVVPLIAPAVKASTQLLASAAAETTAFAHVPLADQPAAGVTMQRIEEELDPAHDEVQALSDATWEHDAGGEGTDDAASGQTAADGLDEEDAGDGAAASKPELAADAAAGGGGGAAGHGPPAARPRNRKRLNPQRARLHSQALVMSPVQTVTAAEPVEAPLPMVTVGPIPKRRRTGSSREPRNALQARLEAAGGDDDEKQDGTVRRAAASSDGQVSDGRAVAEAHSRQRKRSSAVAEEDGEGSADATEPICDLQATMKRAKIGSRGATAKSGQLGADRPHRRGSKPAEAEPAPACEPGPQAQDAGQPNTGKRKTRGNEDAEAAVGSRRAATAPKATVAISPRRRRTVAVLDPRLGGTATKSTAAKKSAAGRSAAKGTKPFGHHPCFALRGLHTRVGLHATLRFSTPENPFQLWHAAAPCSHL